MSASAAYGLDEVVYSVKGVTPLPRDGDRIEIKTDVYLSDLEVSRVVMAIDGIVSDDPISCVETVAMQITSANFDLTGLPYIVY